MHTLARVVMGSLAAATLASAASTASAAEFPERPIEMIIPFGAGSGADIEGRLLADEMSKVLGQPVWRLRSVGARCRTHSWTWRSPM